MSDAAASTVKTVEGGCRCGRVRFRVTGNALVTMACHCTGCQRMTASAYSLSGLYPAEAFAVIEGEPVIGGLHGPTRHFHCDHCKSWLFTRPEGLDAFVNIRTTMLDARMSARPSSRPIPRKRCPGPRLALRTAIQNFRPRNPSAR